jgi:hypothetical protein
MFDSPDHWAWLVCSGQQPRCDFDRGRTTFITCRSSSGLPRILSCDMLNLPVLQAHSSVGEWSEDGVVSRRPLSRYLRRHCHQCHWHKTRPVARRRRYVNTSSFSTRAIWSRNGGSRSVLPVAVMRLGKLIRDFFPVCSLSGTRWPSSSPNKACSLLRGNNLGASRL